MSDKNENILKLNNPGLFRSQAYTNGAWVDADDGSTFTVSNPADQRLLTRVPDQGVAETRRAIEAANAAWPRTSMPVTSVVYGGWPKVWSMDWFVSMTAFCLPRSHRLVG